MTDRCDSQQPLMESLRCALPKGHKGRHSADPLEIQKAIDQVAERLWLKNNPRRKRPVRRTIT